MSEAALSGIKVLDLTHFISGPYCTKVLADYGAEVVKVERPGIGDGARVVGPFPNDNPHYEKSGLFLYLNTNKKGVTLNLKSRTGCKILKDLVKESDILVENFSPGVMSHLGLNYEILEEINPRLVMTSISNFGQSGPYRDYKATELVVDAMGGWSGIIGHPDREPLKPGGNQAQFVAGLFGAIGTLTAFYGQEITGIGQCLDISIMDAVLYIQMNITSMYSYNGMIRKRNGNRVWPPPGTILPCKDGYIGVIAVTTHQWETLCHWMGMPELIDDPRFRTNTDRALNADELDAILISWLGEHRADDLQREGQRRRLPFAVPASTKRLLESEHLERREFFTNIEHPIVGKVTYPGAQFKLDHLPYELKPAPLLGEHNEEIYCGRLGYSKDDLVRLRKQGVI